QARTVIKPLVGARDDGPGDAAVVLPVRGSQRGLAVACGINPRYARLDPYAMAGCVIDEAVRNCVAVGADPERIALLDNFCWGNTERPETLGSLVRAAQGCHDLAIAYGTPFISGKDSLNNEFAHEGRHIVIPPTLLISALGQVPDVRRCVTMDLKEPGNVLLLLGQTKAELGGSHHHLVTGEAGEVVPRPDLESAPGLVRAVFQVVERGLVRSWRDRSEGGLAVAAAEMAFAGGVGADLTPAEGKWPIPEDEVFLFSESCTRFILEVKPENLEEVLRGLGKLPVTRLGQTCKEPRLRIAGSGGEWVVWAPLADMKEAWQKPLRW